MAIAFPEDNDPVKRLIRQHQQVVAALAPAASVARALQLREQALGGAAAKILEQQRNIAESLAGPANSIFDQQRRLQELTAAPLRQLVEQQQQIADALTGPARSALEQQQRLQELAEGPLLRIREQQELIAKAMGESLYRSLEDVVDAALENAEQATAEPDEPEADLASDLGGWIPTREQAEILIEIARLIIIMVFLVWLRTGHVISESTQLELDGLMSFMIVLNKFRRQ